MNPSPQPSKPEEIYELVIQVPMDNSLPAEQVLTEQVDEADERLAPRYIP